jgi:hypothetical protein
MPSRSTILARNLGARQGNSRGLAASDDARKVRANVLSDRLSHSNLCMFGVSCVIACGTLRRQIIITIIT